MASISQFIDILLGPCVRRIESDIKIIYLTFDDGPNADCTPHVQNLLQKYNVKATYFLIGNKIDKNISIFNRIKDEGNAIGNHSPDHKIKNYFKGKKVLKKWIDQSETTISTLSGKPSIGFRPPAGVRTPELRLIMKEINNKPIMWKYRFYDGVFNFNDSSWQRKIKKIKCGTLNIDTHKNT